MWQFVYCKKSHILVRSASRCTTKSCSALLFGCLLLRYGFCSLSGWIWCSGSKVINENVPILGFELGFEILSFLRDLVEIARCISS